VEWSGVWGRELEEEPIIAEEIITCFKLWGVWSFLESIITYRKKAIKALGGGAWRASSLAGS